MISFRVRGCCQREQFQTFTLRQHNRKKLTDDDLFYDPDADDEDQRWVDDLRLSYAAGGGGGGDSKKSAARQENAKRGVRALPNSDAVLNCPACFTVLCLDCQRHELYQNQFREADFMFI